MSDRDTGVALIVIGAVLMLVGVFFWPLCGIGILLLIIGIVMAAAGGAQPAYYPPPYYPYPPQAPQAPVAGPQAPPNCPVCGQPLSWIAQYGRWYCARCQQYR